MTHGRQFAAQETAVWVGRTVCRSTALCSALFALAAFSLAVVASGQTVSNAACVGVAFTGIAVEAIVISRMSSFVATVVVAVLALICAGIVSLIFGTYDFRQFTISVAAFVLVCGYILLSITDSLLAVAEIAQSLRERRATELDNESRALAATRAAAQSSADLHDRLANTLLAVRLSWPDDATASRLSSDIAYLQEPTEASASDVTPVVAMIAQLEEFASQLELTADLDVSPGVRNVELASDVAQRVLTVAREALLNISKHVPDKHAFVTIDFQGQALAISVADHGPGFDGADSKTLGGYGLAKILTPDPTYPSVDVRMEKSPGGGVDIRILIDITAGKEQKDGETLPTWERVATVPVARSFAFWLIGLSATAMVIYFDYFPIWWWLVLALIGTAAPMCLLVGSAIGNDPRVVVAALLTLALVMIAPGLVATDQVTTAAAWLVFVPASLIVFLLCWLSVYRHVVLLAVGVLAVSTAIDIVAFQIEAPQVWIITWLAVAITGYGVNRLRKSFAKLDYEQAQLAHEFDERLRKMQDERETQLTREAMVTRCIQRIEPVISALLASNRMTDSLNRQLADGEATVRSALELGSQPGPIGRDLLDILWCANENGVVMSTKGIAFSEFTQLPGSVKWELEQLVTSKPAGSLLALTSYATAQGYELMAVVSSGSTRDVTQWSIPHGSPIHDDSVGIAT